jgi:hypothetical protein
MARAIRDTRIDSRSARNHLIARSEPYWARLMKGCYLGYRKATKGSGSWIARFRDTTGRQNFRSIAAADDVVDTDGVAVLTFDQVQERARAWFEEMATGDLSSRRRGPYMIANCMRDYLDWAKQHRKSAAHLETYIRAFILPQLGNVDASKLTTRDASKVAPCHRRRSASAADRKGAAAATQSRGP